MATLIKRDPFNEAHGDADESLRLTALKEGHVLTKQDVTDIQNLIADFSDELQNSIEIYAEAYHQALIRISPNKAELIKTIEELEASLMHERIMKKLNLKPPTDSSGAN